MRIAIGSDKSGFFLKEAVKKHLLDLGHEIIDAGTQDMDHGVPYYQVASNVAKLIQENKYEKGILCCGTGMGMSVVANKFDGIYAACCESLYAAQKCRAINNANVLTMGGWVIAEGMGIEMVDAFLNTEFTQGLESWRAEFVTNSFGKLKELEKENFAK